MSYESPVLEASPASIAVAAQRLREGKLVAMPTETVYGLGANALNEAAARRIFEVKGRPPTDPLIVHVVDVACMESLWDVDAATLALGRRLAAAFWPGPLTLVARAAAVVPTAVTGGSGFVGLRYPAHPVAQELIRVSGLVIAAPSANTFGHVSPTTAAHVAKDLAARDPTLTILDGGSCAIGIESTVVKLISAEHVEVLRRGAVSADDIVSCLRDFTSAPSSPTTTSGAASSDLPSTADGAPAGIINRVAVTIRDTRARYASQHVAMDGPGQLLTHYSPDVPSFLVTPASLEPLLLAIADRRSSSQQTEDATMPPIECEVELPDGTSVPLSSVLILDFAGDLAVLRQLPSGASCLAYRNLSRDGRAQEACHEVFDALRWTETVEGAKAAVFPLVTEFHAPTMTPNPSSLAGDQENHQEAGSARVAAVPAEEEDKSASESGPGTGAAATAASPSSASRAHNEYAALLDAVEDRLFRAASGRVVQLRVNGAFAVAATAAAGQNDAKREGEEARSGGES